MTKFPMSKLSAWLADNGGEMADLHGAVFSVAQIFITNSQNFLDKENGFR